MLSAVSKGHDVQSRFLGLNNNNNNNNTNNNNNNNNKVFPLQA
jgi:hypothetical protein